MKETISRLLLLAAVFPAALPAAAADINARGVVKKVDPPRQIVNVAHEPIPELGWSAMMMDFKVKDAKLFEGLRAGQKIEFGLELTSEGHYQIVRIGPAK